MCHGVSPKKKGKKKKFTDPSGGFVGILGRNYA